MTAPVATLRVERIHPLKTYCTDGVTLYRVHLRIEADADAIGQGCISLIVNGSASKVFIPGREFCLVPAEQLTPGPLSKFREGVAERLGVS